MRKRNLFKRVSTSWRTRIKRFRKRLRAIVAPLSTRERFVYGGLILVVLSLFVAPRITANVSDEGSLFAVAATQCSADDQWLYPQHVTGQSSLTNQQTRTDIDASNAALWTGEAGSITCSGYTPVLDHNRVNNGVQVVLRVVPGKHTDYVSEGTAQPTTAVLQEGAVLNERIEKRDTLVSPNQFNTDNTTTDIDSLILISISKNGGETWEPLHSIDGDIISATEAAINIELPVDYSSEVSNLAIKVETSQDSDDTVVLLESVLWTYEVGAPTELSAELIQGDDHVVTNELPVFNRSDDLRVSIGAKNPNDGLLQGIVGKASGVVSGNESNVSVRAVVVDGDGNTISQTTYDAVYTGTDINSTDTWETDLDFFPNSADPGKYTLQLEVETTDGGLKTISQDFLWGVLALNLDRDTYLVGETAQVQMTVLDERGATVCDAKLDLAISSTNSTNSYTTDEAIQTSDTCLEYGSHIEADYRVDHTFTETGTYDINLTATTENGTYRIYESITVAESDDVRISRSGPTRVYPLVNYPMTLQIESSTEFSGTIREKLPIDFKPLPHGTAISYDRVSYSGSSQYLEWDVSMMAGEKIEIGYQFDAPDIAPEFYLLGPLALESDTGTVVTEQRSWQLAGDAIGRMIVLFSGASIPTDWTCVSCVSGDAFFQRFPKGASTYGGTGGSINHTHTVSATVNPSATASSEDRAGTAISNVAHSHSLSISLSPSNNLPSYRQLKFIRYNFTNEPPTLPAGTVGIFDSTSLPTGWTRYSAQDGYHIRGENTVGGTGGANTHTESFSGVVTGGASTTNARDSRTTGQQTTAAASGHTHTVSGTSASANNEPPYIQVVLATNASAEAIPTGIIAMWDDEAPTTWDRLSDGGGPFNGRYLKGAATYGTTGGSSTHVHADLTGLTSSVPSATIAGRPGSAGAGPAHTHTVNVTNFSNESHEPPYREVVFTKYVPVTKYEQSSYRFYENDNSTDVGSPIDTQNTAVESPDQGTPFRLRTNIHVSSVDLSSSGESFKLQIAEQSGSCDVDFTGESYVDVGTASGDIRYYDNPGASDGDALTGNANDPTHSTDTVNDQTYEEANNFTNSQSAIPKGEDGMWDFSLVDISAEAETTYCLRIVKSGGGLLDTYTVIPEFTTPPAPPQMLMLFDGGTIPTGWTCVSCTIGDPFYDNFIRGAAAYGSTGGSTTHTHTASGSVATTGTAAIAESQAGTGVSTPTHTHTYTPTIQPGSNLPAYRQLRVIRYNAGTPSTIPTGAIALFDTATMPTDFTRYATQDGSYVRGHDTVGSTGGSNTHTHTISGTTSVSSNLTTVNPRTTGSTSPDATDAHDHDINSNTPALNQEPPYIEVYLGRANTDTSLPGSLITMWTQDPGGSWSCVSCTGSDPLYQNFFKPANGYGTTGGSTQHTHSDVTGITSGGANQTVDGRNGSAGDGAGHTHTVSATSFSTENHMPPYIDVPFYQSASTNTAPDAPTNLAQTKTNLTSLSVGDWTSESSVVFSADATDTDNPDTLFLCVELQPLSTPFTNTETLCGTSESYTGSTVTPSVTITGLTDGEEYHWQARIKDAFGAYSSWLSFGANAESARDFAVDSSVPTGTVYDGSTGGVDVGFNTGSLSTLSGNWIIDSSASGLSGYEYSIGTIPGATDIKDWTNNGTSTSFTDSSLTLNTSQPYFINVRTTDNAGGQSTISSDGQFVAPTLNFTLSASSLDIGNLNATNSFTSSTSATVTTSTNAYNGYVVRGFASGLLDDGTNTIGMFDGGTYLVPDAWESGDIGFGYTSSDTSIQGSNIFNGSPCAGGGSPPCYAPWSTTAPGDIIADHTSTVSGTPIVNESFTITMRVTAADYQEPGDYATTIVFSVTAMY